MTRLVANLYRGFGPITGGSSPPPTPTLSQPTDNGDGTGATASISGSQAGSTNTVQVAPWSGPGSQLNWTTAATRTGDGSVSVALTDGFYVARCWSTVGGLPSLVSDEPVFQVTGGASYLSVHEALANKIATTIQSFLGTTIVGPATSSVRIRKFPSYIDFTATTPTPPDKNWTLPAILVVYWDQEEVDLFGPPNNRDDIWYPLTVCYLQSVQGQQVPAEALAGNILRWREVVERYFTHVRGWGAPFGVTANGNTYQFHDCRPKPGAIFDQRQVNQVKIDFSWMTFSFVTRRFGGTV